MKNALPIYTHINDARKINKAKKPLYSKVSSGQSLKISRKLIFWETILLPFVFVFDIITIYWQKRGIPIFKHEVISMKLTPQFSPSFKPNFEIEKTVWQHDYRLGKKYLLNFLRENKFQKIYILALSTSYELEKKMQSHCMLRHILESLALICSRADFHISTAKQKNIASPKWLIKILIFFHIQILPAADSLDKEAFVLQNKGIPILCNDLPRIKWD